MRVRTLLVLIIILALVSPLLSSFSYVQIQGFSYKNFGSGPTILVVAKESYVYARVQLTIVPYQNVEVRKQNGTTNVVNESVTVRFSNGTSLGLSSERTFTFILPNSVFFSFASVGTGGPGWVVQKSNPIGGAVLSGNDTIGVVPGLQGVSGLDTFFLYIDGDASVTATVLGVSV